MLKKGLKIFGVLFGLFVALIIGAAIFSPEKAPESQIAFTEQINEFRTVMKEVKESGNQVQQKKLEGLYDSFINESREVQSWYANVISVIESEDGIQIKASYSDNQHDSYADYTQLYHLAINKKHAIQALSNLKKGDDIFFTGSLGEEMSLTFSGSLEQPEFYFEPQSIKLSLEGKAISM
ncbi:hypothetical protein [Vibrio sp. HN007]|uniref:hypothetical protein n=1 Tax=Vibrio iocasae TaxID=3098914 RepID=UPI0035D42B8E